MKAAHQHPTVRCKCKIKFISLQKKNPDLDTDRVRDKYGKIPHLMYKLVKNSKITIKMNEITILSFIKSRFIISY